MLQERLLTQNHLCVDGPPNVVRGTALIGVALETSIDGGCESCVTNNFSGGMSPDPDLVDAGSEP